MDFGSYQLDQFLNLLVSPRGLVGIIGLVLLVAFSVRFPVLRWLVLSVVLFIPLVTSYSTRAEDQFVRPFDTITAYGRPLVVVCMFLIIVMSLVVTNHSRAHIVSPIAVALYAFQCCFDLVGFLHGDAARAFLSLIIHTLTFLALAYGIGRWLQSEREIRLLLWAIVGAGVFFIGGTMAQLSVNDALAISGGRLQGISGNPNFAGIILSLTTVAAIVLLALKGQTWLGRLSLLVFIGLALVFLGWTASRTAALAGAVALLITFRGHLRRFGVITAFVVVSVLAFATFYEDASATAEGLLRTNNSRAAVWASMWQGFIDYPLIGAPRDDSVVVVGSENSYLLVAAQSGILGLVPLMLATLVATMCVFGLWRQRSFLQPESLLMNYVIGSVVAIGVAAQFEGFLAAVIGFGPFHAYLIFAIHQFLVETARRRQSMGAYEGQYESLPLEGYAYYST